MALDELQRRARESYLGSSDAPAVVDEDPWRSRYDVWAEKTRRAQGDQGSSAKSLGQYLEPCLLSWLEDRLATQLSRNQFFIHPNEVMCANLDALAIGGVKEPALVEAKSSGLLANAPRFFDQWGEEGTDEVPTHTLIQVHHQFAVVGANRDLPPIRLALIPALLQGRGIVLFKVRRNDDLVEALIAREERFWREHVLANLAPPDAVPSLETIRRFARVANKTVEVSTELVAAWQDAKGWREVAAALEEERKGFLLAALDDAEAGTCGLGTVTYFEHTRAAYDVKETKVRQLRLKAPPKEGKKRGRK